MLRVHLLRLYFAVCTCASPFHAWYIQLVYNYKKVAWYIQQVYNYKKVDLPMASTIDFQCHYFKTKMYFPFGVVFVV